MKQRMLNPQENDVIVREILLILHDGATKLLPDYNIRRWPPTLPVQAEAAILGYGDALDTLVVEIDLLINQYQSKQKLLEEVVQQAHDLLIGRLKQMVENIEVTKRNSVFHPNRIPTMLELPEFQVVLNAMVQRLAELQQRYFPQKFMPAPYTGQTPTQPLPAQSPAEEDVRASDSRNGY